MNKESKEAIKTIFDNFDKDKSNFIDIKEIQQIAKELGSEISEEEMKKIFSDLDFNKDGKISFEEFWDWWTYGRANKLERLVFLKLKAMNLLKKAHGNFVRYGASLESKFDNALDHHYIALNMGVPSPETLLALRVFLRGEAPTVFQEISKGLNLANEFIGVVLRFDSPAPSDAKVEIDRILTAIREKGESVFPELGIILPFVEFKTEVCENCVVLSVEVKHPFFEDLIESYQKQFLDIVGPDFLMKLNLEIGLKNSFKKLIENLNQKFVAFFFEGFIAELKLSLNSTFLRTIRKTALQFLIETGGKKSFTNWGVLFSLIQGSKFHLVFREVEDVNKLFSGMGVDVLLDAQPSVQDILDEVKNDYKIPSTTQHPIIMSLINFCQKHVCAHLSVGLKLPEAIALIKFDGSGVKELCNYLLSDKK